MAINSKRYFFDRKAVTDAVSRAELRNMSAHGASMRRTARASMKKSKKDVHSMPGAPPHRHSETGQKIWRHLYFVYDPATRSVVTGPEKLQGTAGKDVPHALEFGGTVLVTVKRLTRNDVESLKGKSQEERQHFFHDLKERNKMAGSQVFLRKRPYMNPALQKEIQMGNMERVWTNSVKGY